MSERREAPRLPWLARVAWLAWLMLSVLGAGALHLERTASRALVSSHAARARGELMMAVLYAEEAAECAPLPGAAEGRALLAQYAAEAEANKDGAGAALAWQAYERAARSTGNYTPDDAATVRAGLARASVPEGASLGAAKVPRLPEASPRSAASLLSLAALAVLVVGGLFVATRTRATLLGLAAITLVFAGIGYLV